MPTTTVYEHILDELASGQLEDLEKTIFHALRRVYPAGLTRAQLIQETAGYTPAPTENLNNNRHDRKNRAAVASMFNKGIPVVSTSGNAGYRLVVEPTYLMAMEKELKSRRDRLNEKINAAHRTLVKVRESGRDAIPTNVTDAPVQLTFIHSSPHPALPHLGEHKMGEGG
jgi:hypothetical protein